MTIKERIALARKACERYHCLGDPSKWDDADNFTAILDSHERMEKALRMYLQFDDAEGTTGYLVTESYQECAMCIERSQINVPIAHEDWCYMLCHEAAEQAIAALDKEPKENPDA